MHLSAQEEYGLRCLLRLALDEGEGVMRVQDIAEAEGLSPEYVSKLMRVLRLGGLVDSTRGACGGYRLSQTADSITLWDAIEVLGGSFFPECFCEAHPGIRRDCARADDCSIRVLWRTVSDLVRGGLSRVSLADLKRGEEAMRTWLTTDVSWVSEALAGSTPRARGEGA